MKSFLSLFNVATILIGFSFSGAAFAAPPSPSLPGTSHEVVAQSYAPPTFENIARTFWAMNIHQVEDDEAVDNFLKITECDLYTRFFLNEFEWKKIREATRAYLSKYKSTFPRRFEYVQPLLLDRYDFDLKGFGLMPESAFIQSTKMEMAMNLDDKAKCAQLGLDSLPGYPSAVMLTVKQPFKLSFVRVNEDLAQEFLKMIEEKQIDIKGGRPAYIRFRVRFDRYIGLQNLGQNVYANFGGVIETIEVFADRDLMFKLYEQALY